MIVIPYNRILIFSVFYRIVHNHDKIPIILY